MRELCPFCYELDEIVEEWNLVEKRKGNERFVVSEGFLHSYCEACGRILPHRAKDYAVEIYGRRVEPVGSYWNKHYDKLIKNRHKVLGGADEKQDSVSLSRKGNGKS